MKSAAKMSLACQIKHYADQVSTNANLVAASLEAQSAGLPHDISPELASVRMELAEAAFELFNLSQDTGSFLTHLTVDCHLIYALRWLYHFNILRLIPLHGTITYRELADAADAPENLLRGALRLAMTSRIFEEPALGVVTHSPVSRQMAVDGDLEHWVPYISNTLVPTAAKHVEATEKWRNSKHVNNTAHNLAFNHNLSYFDFISQDSRRGIEFARTMKAVSNTPYFDNSHLVESYDWASIGGGSVVDMGGSTGHASIALAGAFPDLEFIVQDLPDVITDSVKQFDERKLPQPLTSRIQFQVHSFFNPQPVRGASIYLLRHILHDWPDKEAVQILRSIIPVLGPESKILVSDIILPEQGSIPATEERIMRMNDLLLHQFTNTSERTLQNWEAVFTAVSPRLRIQRVYRNPGSILSLMELTLA